MLLLVICIVLLMIENALYTNIGHHSFLAYSVFRSHRKRAASITLAALQL